VFLITLGKLLAWILLRAYPKDPNTISVLFWSFCHLTKMAHFVPCHKEITTKKDCWSLY
jgi:hypothetical protein